MGYFKVRYDSRVVIYDRKTVIRLTTGFRHHDRYKRRRWDLNSNCLCSSSYELGVINSPIFETKGQLCKSFFEAVGVSD